MDNLFIHCENCCEENYMEKWVGYSDLERSSGKSIVNKIFFENDKLIVGVDDEVKSIAITFQNLYAYKYSIESGIIDRLQTVYRENEGSLIYTVENSDYIKDFEFQSSGTRPIENLKHYLLMDSIDTVVEVLALSEPVIIQE